MTATCDDIQLPPDLPLIATAEADGDDRLDHALAGELLDLGRLVDALGDASQDMTTREKAILFGRLVDIADTVGQLLEWAEGIA